MINPTLTGTGPAWRGYCGLQTRWTCSCGARNWWSKSKCQKEDWLFEYWAVSFPKKKDEKDKHHTANFFFVLLVHVWLETSWGDIVCAQHQKQTKTTRVVFQKIQKQSLSDQTLCHFAKHSHQHNPITVGGHRVTTDAATNTKERSIKMNTKPKEGKKQTCCCSFFFSGSHQKGFWSILVLIFLFHCFAAMYCLFELKENKTEKQKRRTNDMNKSTRKNEQTQTQNRPVHFRRHWTEIWFFLSFLKQTTIPSNKCSFSNLSKECQTKSQLGGQGFGFDCIWWRCCECVDVCMKVLEDRLGVLILERANLIIKMIISCAWLNSLCGFWLECWSKFLRQFELC